MPANRFRIAIVGPGRSGKDHAANWFHENTILTYGGVSSQPITEYISDKLGLAFHECHAMRTQCRPLWGRVGDLLRADDPAYFARLQLELGDIVVGTRRADEIEAIKREGLVTEVLWIDRAGVGDDPSLTFGWEAADWLVPNHFGIDAFEDSLRSYAQARGILKTD